MADRISVNQTDATKAMNQIKNKANDVRTGMDKMLRDVRATSSWWQGNSQAAFVEQMENFAAKFNAEVEECLERNAQLLQTIITAFQDADDRIAAATRNMN